jgi:hypothetical protein
MFEQDAADRRTRDIVEAELLEFAEDTAVAPAGGLGHLGDQLTDRLRLTGPASPTAFDAEPVLTDPASEGPRVDDGNDVLTKPLFRNTLRPAPIANAG